MCLLDQRNASGEVTPSVPTPFGYSGSHTMPVTLVAASLSMVGSFLIIFTYCVWQDIHSTARRFLVYVSIADFVNSGGNLLGVLLNAEHHKRGCEIQSCFTTSSSLGFIFWTTYLAAFLYMSIVRGHVKLSLWTRASLFLTGWGVPVAVTVAAYLSGALGNDESSVSAGWCWTKDNPTLPASLNCEDARLMWRLLAGKGWEILSYIVVPIFYVLVHLHIKKESKFPNETLIKPATLQAAQKIHRKFTALPMIYVLLRVWGTIRFVMDAVDMNDEQRMPRWVYITLLFLHAFGDNGQGFANFIVFCLFTERIRVRLKRAFQCGSRQRTDGKDRTVQRERLMHSQEQDIFNTGLAEHNDPERTPLLSNGTSRKLTNSV